MKETKTVQVRVSPEANTSAELVGTTWQVPSSISPDQRLSWIESVHRETQARKTADAEAQARNGRVLNDRIDQQRAVVVSEQINGVEATVLAVQDRIAELEERIAQLDLAKYADIANNTTQAMARTMDLQRLVENLSERVRDLTIHTQETADLTKQDREQTLATLRSWQELMNQGQAAATERIHAAEARTKAEIQHSRELQEQLQTDVETIRKAASITDEARGIARQAALDVADTQAEQFKSMMTLVLMACGITRRDLDAQLNRLDQALELGLPLLDDNFIAASVQIAKKKADARLDAERLANEAAARSTAFINLTGDEIISTAQPKKGKR